MASDSGVKLRTRGVGYAYGSRAVLNEIERRRAGVGYVKTDRGLEVDFLVRRPGEAPELIQVCLPNSIYSPTNQIHSRTEPRLDSLHPLMIALNCRFTISWAPWYTRKKAVFLRGSIISNSTDRPWPPEPIFTG